MKNHYFSNRGPIHPGLSIFALAFVSIGSHGAEAALSASSLQARAGGSATISLSWSDSSSGVQSYVLERSLSSSGGYVTVTRTSGSTFSWQDTGLADAKTYFYRVRNVQKIRRKTIYGPYSNVASATTLGAPVLPTVSSIGPQAVQSTALSRGTLFASPAGSGTACSISAPCALQTAGDRAVAGDVVFLRGGTYSVTQSIYFRGAGQSNAYITFESYPGEWAILDGSGLDISQEIYVRITGSRNVLRRFEIRNMPKAGLWVGGNYNLIDGLQVHHNKLTGIQVFSPYESFPYGQYGSYNTIQNCTVTDNSGAGLGGEYADGGNTDGIQIASGEGNRIIYNFVAGNSDDGIDSWRSTNTYIGYSIVTGSGIASGNGNGVKAGGAAPSKGTVVEHVLAYRNKASGFDTNSGIDVTFRKNTSWANAGYGFYTYSTTLVDSNISSADTEGVIGGAGSARNNSWQRAGSISFISTDPNSPSFLKPILGGGFEDIGAWAP